MIYLSLMAASAPTALPPGIVLLPTLFMGSENQFHPLHPRLKCLQTYTTKDEAGKDVQRQRVYHDAKAVSDMADSFHVAGIKLVQLDWEPWAFGGLNQATNAIAIKLRQAFKDRGVTLDFWGAGGGGETDPNTMLFANMSKRLWPAWYSFTKHIDVWLADRTAKLLTLRKTHRASGKEIIPEISPFSDGGSHNGEPNDPDGAPIGEERWRAMVGLTRYADGMCAWLNLAEELPGGGSRLLPWDDGAWWMPALVEAAKAQ